LNTIVEGGSVVSYKLKVTGWRPDELNEFSMYLILAAALGPGDYTASNGNAFQKQRNNVSVEWSHL
jgi:hypothetical protein